jgi:radical SAM superfamily enzyme YgiQ (UPF0313 family)
MNLLVIYPGLVDGFGSFSSGSDWFNHGVGIICAVLKREGHQVRYLDCRTCRDWSDVRAKIIEAPFDAVLISVSTVDFAAFKQIVALVRKVAPQARIIAGGPHATLATDDMLAVTDCDCIFTHEAEVTLPKLLKDLDALPRLVRGEMPEDLDQLPFVDRSLSPSGETPLFWGIRRPFFTITASRGCPFKCTFCQPAERYVFGDKIRKRSVPNLIAELELLRDSYGMKSFMIHDDCFTQFPQWVDDFCRLKIERGLQQPFICQTRADIVCNRRDMIERLAQAGLKWVLIGFESGSDRILSFIKKGVTVQQNIEAADICRELGIKIFANYMFGLPTETPDEMEATALMMQRIAPDIHSPSVFTPAPGSDLYEYCRSEDLILISNSEGYRRNVNSGAKIKGVDYDHVSRMVKLSMRGAFFKRSRFALQLLQNALMRGLRVI